MEKIILKAKKMFWGKMYIQAKEYPAPIRIYLARKLLQLNQNIELGG